ncbi:AAA family ATPase [Myxococcus sp. K38C18041901]|uniref:AAA family ATPase n=1 Tax=Myxococcus guangdongensis TaxID=2906760 RepID=UPI0020A6FDC9|nr:AAA family ATPase [Myxococcus guangdongensis]MCP3059785.1 AAA family ATPase [Myxococcus guangdongensis]
MKIREVRIRHLRNFGAEMRPIRFYDEETGLVRPLSVMVGSNGSGKSTIFQVMEGLLSFALDVVEDRPITHDIRDNGYAALNVDFGSAPFPQLLGGVWIALGRKDRAPEGFRSLSNQICRIEQRGGSGKPLLQKGPRQALNEWVGRMMRGDAKPEEGGLLFFPHNRWIEHEQRGAIEPPPRSKPWLFRFEPQTRWHGSLSQLWVWQNYLDLEQHREGRASLLPFVQIIEQILGRGQQIVIREGHVQIERPEHGDSVEPHQLPSGEQQVLALFGEIIRFLRPGAVILIDEVEISLHPALQRTVLFHLREIARRYDLQIIVTTHSMDIISAVSPTEIINLDDMVFQEKGRVQGAAK